MNHKNQAQTKFCVILHCTKTDQSEVKSISFESSPIEVLEIKQQIERQYSIPVCVQIVSFDGYTLKDNEILSVLKIRDGDTFCVDYLGKGDCSDLMKIISWLSQLSNAITSLTSRQFLVISNIVIVGIQRQWIQSLRSYFTSRNNSAYENRLYFLHNGGFEMMMKIYQFLLQMEWKKMPENYQYLEQWIIRSMWSFARTFPICRYVVSKNLIQLLTQSLVRVRLKESKVIDSARNQHRSNLVQAIFCSIGVLTNLIELPECKLEIAANKDVLHQVSCFSVVPLISANYRRRSALFFVYLAYDSQTHPYIADSVNVQRLLRGCGTRDSDPRTHILFEYLVLLFLMQVCLISPHCFAPDWCKIITDKMESFLQKHTYLLLRDIETSNGINNLILIPYIKLVYIPNTPPRTEPMLPIEKFQTVSLQFTIFCLQNGLGRESQRQALLKEGLLDYVVCMPQYVTPSLRAQAEELVQMVVSSPDIPEGPPKLLNLVKAKLAKMYFGLEQILSLSVSEIVSKAWPNSCMS